MLNGLLNVDKPQGWTSHDVVARIRRVAGQREVGHAGTLDPLASGVLVVLLGKATKLAAYLSSTDKTYCAQVVFGAITATDDAEGPALTISEASGVTQRQVEEQLPAFVGEIRQVPPAYAAIKVEGKKLYEQARKGAETKREPRDVTIHSIDVVAFDPPRATLRVACSSGMYVRSLARDLGEALGVGAYLHALRRIAAGSFRVEHSAPVDGLELGKLQAGLLPVDLAVLQLAAVPLDAHEEQLIRNGRSIELQASLAGNVRLYGPSGSLVALARSENGVLKPFRVFSLEEEIDADRP